ncbi:MAG: GTP 3',8-cyclase MoaA [Clostridiales bacterium]|jgi:cyclic pyranopterin phosphate synthase|nr:GTP 3',8-cyclase MoaA [Clostridiales bacterium]
MIDGFNRKIEYLRLSVTKKCMEKCIYCSKDDEKCAVKGEELPAEAFIKIADACAKLHINKVRLTGGEPLLRHDLEEIVRGIYDLNNYKDITITTNAQLLAGKAAALKKAGVNRCNISLDSLKPDVYKEMTGGDLNKVFKGIEAAFNESMLPIKINTVLIKGKNDGEIDDFIELAKQYPLSVRFIELMPVGDMLLTGISNEKIIKEHKYLLPLNTDEKSSGPAKIYTAKGFKGNVGFISPITNCFCSSCNRIRVTSDAYLKPCLGNEAEYSLKEALSLDTNELAKTISEIIRKKPQNHTFSDVFNADRKMKDIGG